MQQADHSLLENLDKGALAIESLAEGLPVLL